MRVKVQVTGKVQGVFFRHSAKQKAEELKITGWIKNLDDGSVLSEVSGPKESVSAFIDWCYRGPTNALVKAVFVEEIAVEAAQEASFSIIT